VIEKSVSRLADAFLIPFRVFISVSIYPLLMVSYSLFHQYWREAESDFSFIFAA